MSQVETARRALEDVCSGRELDRVGEVYHPQFVDHVNAMEYRGLAGARKSVAVYLALFRTCASSSTSRSATATAWSRAGR